MVYRWLELLQQVGSIASAPSNIGWMLPCLLTCVAVYHPTIPSTLAFNLLCILLLCKQPLACIVPAPHPRCYTLHASPTAHFPPTGSFVQHTCTPLTSHSPALVWRIAPARAHTFISTERAPAARTTAGTCAHTGGMRHYPSARDALAACGNHLDRNHSAAGILGCTGVSCLFGHFVAPTVYNLSLWTCTMRCIWAATG